MRTYLVVAAPGIRVPLEDAPRRAIREQPVAVPDTPYYRRRMADGDLRKVSDNQVEDTRPPASAAPGELHTFEASAPAEGESSAVATDTASKGRALSSTTTVASKGTKKRK